MAKAKPVEVKSYQVRLLFGAWYVTIFKGERQVNKLGPFTFAEAEDAAAKTGLPDKDRLTV